MSVNYAALVKSNPEGVAEKLSEMEAEQNQLRALLAEARQAIVTAVTSEEGLDGAEGGELLDKIQRHLSGERYASAEELAETGLNRDAYLREFPGMTDAIERFEERWGRFVRCGSINFADGRFVMVTRFERVYSIAFHNPKNVGLDAQTLETNLSPVALRGLTLLASAYAQAGDDDAFTAALGLGEGDDQ